MRVKELTLIAIVVVVSSWMVGAQRGAAPAQEAIVPFKIQVPEAVLSDLKQLLARTRFPGEIAGSDWDYGTNLGYLK